MTKLQLETMGIAVNQWISSGFKGILFSNEGHLYSAPNVKYYFDTDNMLLWVRYIDGDKIVPGGINDNQIGIYHLVYDINEIDGIF